MAMSSSQRRCWGSWRSLSNTAPTNISVLILSPSNITFPNLFQLSRRHLPPHRTVISACRRRAATPLTQPSRTMANLPFGLEKILGEPDNLIPTDRERKLKKGYIPEFAPDDLRKEMEELGIDGVEELDELEEKNMEGYNNLGLVPPEGAGTFASPILIPSRMDNRVVGYSDPTTHAMFWFTIHNDNNTYYIKDLGLFFKMLHIPDDEAVAHH